MNKFKLLLATSIFAISSVASAVPITGSIGFNGEYGHNGGLGGLSAATGIMIIDATVDGAVTGSFADEGIAHGDAASYASFTFNPTGAVASIWSVGSFTFNLTTMVNEFQNDNFLLLSGSGAFTSTDAGLDDSYGIWTFSANAAGANFTWSSSNTVPEPAIALLLATGLIGFGVTRKMRKAA